MATKANTPVPRGRPRKTETRCQVVIRPAEDGGYLGIVPTLPAAYSQGETVEQTLARTEEAVAGVVKFYVERGMDIPWESPAKGEARKGDITKWIVINV